MAISFNAYGFPIQRTGVIASYPLLPTNETKTFLFDFEVYPGNSGGPVFMVSQNRFYDNTFHLAEMTRMIVGLVSEEWNTTEIVKSRYKSEFNVYPLKLGVVVHSSFIREAIDALPLPDMKLLPAAVPPGK